MPHTHLRRRRLPPPHLPSARGRQGRLASCGRQWLEGRCPSAQRRVPGVTQQRAPRIPAAAVVRGPAESERQRPPGSCLRCTRSTRRRPASTHTGMLSHAHLQTLARRAHTHRTESRGEGVGAGQAGCLPLAPGKDTVLPPGSGGRPLLAAPGRTDPSGHPSSSSHPDPAERGLGGLRPVPGDPVVI